MWLSSGGPLSIMNISQNFDIFINTLASCTSSPAALEVQFLLLYKFL